MTDTLLAMAVCLIAFLCGIQIGIIIGRDR